jgi:hypothetical protein
MRPGLQAIRQSKNILFNLSGHSHFGLSSYDEYLSGRLADYLSKKEKRPCALTGNPRR